MAARSAAAVVDAAALIQLLSFLECNVPRLRSSLQVNFAVGAFELCRLLKKNPVPTDVTAI